MDRDRRWIGGRWPVVVGLAVVAGTLGCRNTPGSPMGDLTRRGEAAFAATLAGHADRSVEALALLEAAAAQNPKDGRAFMLLGLTRLMRFKRAFADGASDLQKLEIDRARAALDTAMGLLPTDRYVGGFRATATFLDGVTQRREERIDQGVVQFRQTIAGFPEFNMLNFIMAVAPAVAADDPLYREIVDYIAQPLVDTCSPLRLPDTCGNAGAAPHNLDGKLVLFGDVFAKAGDAKAAEGFYRQAIESGGNPSWRLRALVEERVRTLPERIALYQDDDRTNDPLMLGYGRDACLVCHAP